MNSDQLTKTIGDLLASYARETQNADCVGCLFTVFMARDGDPNAVRQELFGAGNGIELAVAMTLTIGVLEERLNVLGPEVRAAADAEVRAMQSVYCDDWKAL